MVEVLEHAELGLRKRKRPRAIDFLTAFVQFGAPGRRPLVFALGLCVGAGWYSAAWSEPYLWTLLLGFGLSCLMLFVAQRWAGRAAIIGVAALISTGVSAGALAGKAAMLRVEHPVITETLGPVMVEGWIDKIEPGRKGPRLRLIVHAIDGVPQAELPGQVRLTHRLSLAVESGRFVRCWAVLRPPPAPVIQGDYAFHRQAYFQGLGAVGYVQGRCRGGTLGLPANQADRWRLTVSKLRRQLAHHVNGVAGGFGAALASGDRSFMATADQDALRGSGLAHLLAISGLHMGIVGGLIYLIVWRGLALVEPLALRIPVQKPAAVTALIASATYLVLSGASVSTQRAFIMALILFGAVLFDRTALSLRSLAIAMILVVVISPWSVLTPGFQMSFAATGALIATYEAWQRRQQDQQTKRRGAVFWTKSLFVTSLVSGLATAPFALYHFDRFAELGLFANLLAMPIISLVTAPMAGAALVLAPFGFSEPALYVFGRSLDAVLAVARFFTSLSPEGLSARQAMPSSTFVLLCLGLVGMIVARGWAWRYGLGIAACFAAGLVWWKTPAAAIHWAPSGDIFLVRETGEVERAMIMDGDGLGPLRYADFEGGQDCGNRVCRFRIAGQTIQLDGMPSLERCDLPEAIQIAISADIERSARCADQQPAWAILDPLRGASWSLKNGQFTRVEAPPCGRRPWDPCLSKFPIRTGE